MDAGYCDVISWRLFDIYGSANNGAFLAEHLEQQPAGTIVAVITGDEPTGVDGHHHNKTPGSGLDVVKPILEDMGVELKGMFHLLRNLN